MFRSERNTTAPTVGDSAFDLKVTSSKTHVSAISLRAFVFSVGLGLSSILGSAAAASAAIETDPTALYADMKKAYDEGTAHGWNFDAQQYYEGVVFAAGRSYSLFESDAPEYPQIAALTVDTATALHYDPLSNDDASTWWVREAAIYSRAHYPDRVTAANELLARIASAEDSPQQAAVVADADATANIASYHREKLALVEAVIIDLRCFAVTGDRRYRSLALARAADRDFPLLYLPGPQEQTIYSFSEAAPADDSFDETDRANAASIIARRNASPELQEIGHIVAHSHKFHLTITAPADEYFGHTGLSVLGIRNEIDRVHRYLDAGWGTRMTGEATSLAESVERLYRAYPRDFDLPRFLLATIGQLDRISDPKAHASADALRQILSIDYAETPEAAQLRGSKS